MTRNGGNLLGITENERKSGQGGEAADSTDSTEPIHLVLQHLRESFSLS
ncbi:hypothetical protein [Neisseria meningitidis]|nr:hypothetical protein [Neisseria meningitidis]